MGKVPLVAEADQYRTRDGKGACPAKPAACATSMDQQEILSPSVVEQGNTNMRTPMCLGTV